ncbi:helix-turn-helix transcriptional regulator [Listeria monocytogenes]|uniref:helix-turn-helix domain-containing protein n=1 Tax=Listeria monocytogenes TaxID=1639 RepID=UPI000873BF8E|nr:helix-turn-helix transcriptional regulator [Listeria monocytogenes]EAC7182498.1 XRE family transcriptional regulator [Listeria monocytogenes]EAC8000871.1 XRE family transcriptional regulator [Listeria monocytogenes]EAC8351028.1 XRE family transcriptional regulator [Listeria monocytogenes]EAD4096302.1 XRE family transcriptional regulator [Listeria monocytogenes]EAD9140633.1 XRE family transcriptional regulator [Listeria monocytogenes]
MFGDNLTKLRKKKRLTQTELANILHVARSTYCLYEKNRRMPASEIQIKIADYFNVTLDYLHDRKNFDNNLLIKHIDDNLTKEEQIKLEKYLRLLRSQND